MENEEEQPNEDFTGLTPDQINKRVIRNMYLRGQKQKAEHQAKLDAQTVSKGVAKYIEKPVRDRFSGKMSYSPEELEQDAEKHRIGKKLF
jgi:hypothetical protein